MTLESYNGCQSHFDRVSRQWTMYGDDIITCPAIKEIMDKPACKSSSKGQGCMHLKNGECTYEAD